MSNSMNRLRTAMLALPALAATLCALWLVPGWVSQQLLASEARQSALAWAELLIRMVPDLEPGLAGRGFSEVAHQRFREVADLPGLQHFKLFDPQGRELLDSAVMDRATSFQASATLAASPLAASVAATRESVVTLVRERADRTEAVFSVACVPLIRAGRTVGVIEVYVDQQVRADQIRTAFLAISATVLLALMVVAVTGAMVWRRRMHCVKATEEQARYLARHDPLSGTLNRASFNEALQYQVWQTQRGDPAFAVLWVNLDHFKRVNDQFGLAAGDAVLREAGARLRNVVRHGDQVARLGSDEFAVLQCDVTGEEDVATLARRVLEALAEPFVVGQTEFAVGGSVGAALWAVDATDVDSLMHKADLALFRAKSDGRGTFSFYDARLDEQLQLRRDLTRELGLAIEQGQLALHFQPLFAGDGVTLTGYEALARWPHPVRGLISPVVFIPLAEDTGLIEPLGRWVLQAACAEAAGWPEPLTVAVNLSAAQFRHADLAATVLATLERTGLAASRLEVEVTESLLISSAESVVGTLRTLAARGVHIAMDDFGTGYSSLAYLWRFPFHKLKIDRAFTQNLENDPKVRVIVRSIISLAHALDIRVNAEGVETEAQMRALRSLGCDELQGFLLGRPAPVDQLTHQASTQVPARGPDQAVALA